ncbi:hypothetical protein [Corynebacterium cystitidis]|uniref:hypothetical protein n=1 Tax=Corynebacterium cystitidis TaxID=35757 RepID=UPI00211F29D3|nr:hypothetical protein [Corynebacterium cystitidis]
MDSLVLQLTIEDIPNSTAIVQVNEDTALLGFARAVLGMYGFTGEANWEISNSRFRTSTPPEMWAIDVRTLFDEHDTATLTYGTEWNITILVIRREEAIAGAFALMHTPPLQVEEGFGGPEKHRELQEVLVAREAGEHLTLRRKKILKAANNLDIREVDENRIADAVHDIGTAGFYTSEPLGDEVNATLGALRLIDLAHLEPTDSESESALLRRLMKAPLAYLSYVEDHPLELTDSGEIQPEQIPALLEAVGLQEASASTSKSQRSTLLHIHTWLEAKGTVERNANQIVLIDEGQAWLDDDLARISGWIMIEKDRDETLLALAAELARTAGVPQRVIDLYFQPEHAPSGEGLRAPTWALLRAAGMLNGGELTDDGRSLLSAMVRLNASLSYVREHRNSPDRLAFKKRVFSESVQALSEESPVFATLFSGVSHMLDISVIENDDTFDQREDFAERMLRPHLDDLDNAPLPILKLLERVGTVNRKGNTFVLSKLGMNAREDAGHLAIWISEQLFPSRSDKERTAQLNDALAVLLGRAKAASLLGVPTDQLNLTILADVGLPGRLDLLQETAELRNLLGLEVENPFQAVEKRLTTIGRSLLEHAVMEELLGDDALLD